MDVRIEQSWKEALSGEFKKPYFKELTEFVRNEYVNKIIYPDPKDIFNAFNLTPFKDVRVVILGQDPYHGPNQAHGLCFSVKRGVPTPPSLQNIYKEINADLGSPIPTHGNLEHWTKQGVLLLNATLTVEAGNAGSHQKKGWEEFTDTAVQVLNDTKENLVFLLWGKYAKEKGAFIDTSKHLVLQASHPSPFAAHNGFFGCKHFSQTNDHLLSLLEQPIEWTLKNEQGSKNKEHSK